MVLGRCCEQWSTGKVSVPILRNCAEYTRTGTRIGKFASSLTESLSEGHKGLVLDQKTNRIGRMNKWFYVMDMHSGGRRKTPFEIYFIEAADECGARARFTAETGQDPDDVFCPCCGTNFAVGGGQNTLEEMTSFWRRGQTLDEYLNDKRNLVKVIPLTNEEDLL